MQNLRIIHDNAADRATLSASATVSGLGVSNLTTDIKSQVCRSATTSLTITATWPSKETIAGVVLPFCNITSLATIRVKGYANAADATPLFDTGDIEACPDSSLQAWDWTQKLGVNTFAYGKTAYARAWIEVPGAVSKLVIELKDSTNPSGYIEVGRLVCGGYWEPDCMVEVGAPLTIVDTSKHYRTDAGDLITDGGVRYRKQTLDLPIMTASDRDALWSLIRKNGMTKPMLISLYPNDPNPQLEQAHQIYCKLATSPIMNTPYFRLHSATLDFEEI